LARVGEVAKELGKDGIVLMNLCGRGDKDIFTVAEALGSRL
jgi:tryptophan synthase beta chain